MRAKWEDRKYYKVILNVPAKCKHDYYYSREKDVALMYTKSIASRTILAPVAHYTSTKSSFLGGTNLLLIFYTTCIHNKLSAELVFQLNQAA